MPTSVSSAASRCNSSNDQKTAGAGGNGSISDVVARIERLPMVFALVTVVGAIVTGLFAVETKRRVLEEISP